MGGKMRYIKSKLTIFLMALLVFGASFVYGGQIKSALAASIAKGGATIDAAVSITAGTYTVGALVEKEPQFYSISVKAGQELTVSGTFKVASEYESYGTNNALEIFDDAKVSLTDAYETAGDPISVATLADSSKATHTYYVKMADDTWGTESGNITIALNDRFDANLGTDAGGGFDVANTITSGSYTGYLSQVDTDDYFIVSADKGSASVKLTPASDATPTVKIYDANRKLLEEKSGSNDGEIFTATAEIEATQKIYIQINCDINNGCVDAASKYSIVISAGGSTSGTGTTVPEDYDIVTPIVPDGGLVTIDKEVAPVLKTVYQDKIKLLEQKGTDTLVYVADRQTTPAADLAAIKAAMEGLGYKTKSLTDTQLIMTKGFKKLTFTVNPNTNKIEVAKGFVMNWLWFGVILGIIVLIALIITAVLISRKKKGSKPQETFPQTEEQKK